MSSQTLSELSTEELVAILNDQLFSLQRYDISKVLEMLSARNIMASELFPRITNAMKKEESKYQDLLDILSTTSLNHIDEFLTFLIFDAPGREVTYYALEAKGLLDWKNKVEIEREEFKNQLDAIIDGGFYDVFRFLARGIVYWHFKGEFDFDTFALGADFDPEDKELMEPLILKMLEFGLSEEYLMDYEATILVRDLKIESALPLLLRVLKKIQYVKKNHYDASKDKFNWFRGYAVDALCAIRAYEAAPALLEALRVEPDVSVLEEIVRSLGGLKHYEAIPYLKGIRHHSIGNYFAEDERDLREALSFALNVLGAEPKNHVEFAAEQIVFFRFDYYDEDELTIFFNCFPVIEDDQYEELFHFTLDQLVIAGENFHQYVDSESFLRYTSRMMLYLELPEKMSNIETVIENISDHERKELARKIVKYFPEEEKNLIKDDFN